MTDASDPHTAPPPGRADAPLRAVHPLRETLYHEVHARPTQSMAAPLLLSHLALVDADPAAVREHLCTLLANRHLPVPGAQESHIISSFGGAHLRWEQHTEFHTYSFWRQQAQDAEPEPLAAVPRDWLAALPGQCLLGLHVRVVKAGAARAETIPASARQWLHEESLIGAHVFDKGASVYTDLRLHADGFGRWVVVVRDMSDAQLGRLAQCILDIETYRMMALLGLPVAREVGRALAGAERDLAQVAERIRNAESHHEPELLKQLTRLAAEVEGLYARTHARFSASQAYFEIVRQRIEELREERQATLQTLREFMEKRLHPAVQTCAWAARRQQALSERISRVSNLLQTRVEIEQQVSSQQLLRAMSGRQKAQFLLQAAVEGLSVAAVTYYSAGLVAYAAKGAQALGVPVSPEIAAAVAVPFVAAAVWLGIRRLHHRVQAEVD
ncbi:MAG: DUF3422 domain-containing protein [Desulfovibrionaceae bacterium]|nr:DUF3422 domain-containing protein [Desulfovibrionaceae bacterium]